MVFLHLPSYLLILGKVAQRPTHDWMHDYASESRIRGHDTATGGTSPLAV